MYLEKKQGTSGFAWFCHGLHYKSLSSKAWETAIRTRITFAWTYCYWSYRLIRRFAIGSNLAKHLYFSSESGYGFVLSGRGLLFPSPLQLSLIFWHWRTNINVEIPFLYSWSTGYLRKDRIRWIVYRNDPSDSRIRRNRFSVSSTFLLLLLIYFCGPCPSELNQLLLRTEC